MKNNFQLIQIIMDLKLFVVLILLSVLRVGQSAEPDITKGPPTYDKPWVPAWGWFGANNRLEWKQYHERFLNQTLQHMEDIKIVFLGDSKTEEWVQEGKGKKVWEKYYVNRGTYNYGIRSDSTRQVLWRIEHDELYGLDPKVLVFFIGGNNFYENYNKGMMF